MPQRTKTAHEIMEKHHEKAIFSYPAQTSESDQKPDSTGTADYSSKLEQIWHEHCDNA